MEDVSVDPEDDTPQLHHDLQRLEEDKTNQVVTIIQLKFPATIQLRFGVCYLPVEETGFSQSEQIYWVCSTSTFFWAAFSQDVRS